MSDLSEFLLARIAEDEDEARAAGGEWWYAAEMPPPSMRRRPDEPTHWIVDSPAILVSYEVTSAEKAQHIARWDPARVLAECEAKRRLVEEVSDFGWAGYAVRDEVLELLALPYADHPDYRQEWRP